MRASKSFAAAAQLVMAILLAQAAAAGAANTLSEGCAYINSGINNGANAPNGSVTMSFFAGETIIIGAAVGNGTPPPAVSKIALYVDDVNSPALQEFRSALFLPPASATVKYEFPSPQTATVTWLVGYDQGQGFQLWLAHYPVWELSCTNVPPQCDNGKQYLGGIDDNYALPTSPTAPGPALAALACSGGSKDFDDVTNDRCVKHTFANIVTPICGATLEFRAKPGTSSQTGNDTINLGSGLPFAWSMKLKDLPEANGTWNAGDPGALFTLDLANLLPNLIPQLNSNGNLDVLIQDDTTVDFMRLTTTCCGCEKTAFGGVQDNYALPPEPTGLLSPLLAALPCSAGDKDFDDLTDDRCVKHTFPGLDVICGATLTFRAKPVGGLSGNDQINLARLGNPTGIGWSQFLGNLPEANGLPWDTAHQPSGGVTFVLDLADLHPTITGFQSNIINAVSQIGHLDVFIQDDTAVDFMTLTTACCPHQKCYSVKALEKTPDDVTRTLEDQFETKETVVKREPVLLCTPVNKQGEDPEFDEKNHTVCYNIKDAKTKPNQPPFVPRNVAVTNQFGANQLLVLKPETVCVPSTKRLLP